MHRSKAKAGVAQRYFGDDAFVAVIPSGYLFNPEYLSFSTAAIGVFAKGAGISMNEILSIQNTFAGLRSSFDPGTPMDPVYTNLPARNVANTRLGFILARGN